MALDGEATRDGIAGLTAAARLPPQINSLVSPDLAGRGRLPAYQDDLRGFDLLAGTALTAGTVLSTEPNSGYLSARITRILYGNECCHH